MKITSGSFSPRPSGVVLKDCTTQCERVARCAGKGNGFDHTWPGFVSRPWNSRAVVLGVNYSPASSPNIHTRGSHLALLTFCVCLSSLPYLWSGWNGNCDISKVNKTEHQFWNVRGLFVIRPLECLALVRDKVNFLRFYTGRDWEELEIFEWGKMDEYPSWLICGV